MIAAVASAAATAAGIGLYRRLTGRFVSEVTLVVDDAFEGVECEGVGQVLGAVLLLEDLDVPYQLKTSSAASASHEEPAHSLTPPLLYAADGVRLANPAAVCLHLGMMHGVAGAGHQLALMLQATLNADQFWLEAHGCLRGGSDRAAGVAYAHSERFTQWLLALQAPLQASLREGPTPESTDLSVAVLLSAVESGEAVMRGQPLSTPSSSTAHFTFGSSPSFADYHLFATLRRIEWVYPERLEATLDQMKLEPLQAWYQRMRERPRIVSFLESERSNILSAAVKGVA